MSSILATLLFSSASLGWCQGDAEQARELVEGVAAAMKESPAVAFDCEVRLKIGELEVPQTAKTVLRRPNLARLELAGAGQDALIVLDGTASWHYLKAGNRYFKSKQRSTTKLEQYGAGPAASLFFGQGAGSLLPYLSDATVTMERLGDEECSVVTWKVGAEQASLAIHGNRLRRYRTTRSIAAQKFEQTFTYGTFDLAPTIADGAFAFVPPKGARAIEQGGDDALLDLGAVAPDFSVTGTDGKVRKLSESRGRPVLLTFWFYG